MDAASQARARLPRWLFPALGYLVSIVGLIWVYKGFDWEDQMDRIRATDWAWAWPSIGFDILVYFCQGWRWSVLLRPLAKVPVLKSTQAVFIGLFANEVLPLRTGEVIRCYLQRRWTGLPLSVVLSSAVIERMLDGMWLIIGFWLTTRYVAVPRWLLEGSRVLVVLLMVAGALVAMAAIYKGHASEAVSRSRWAHVLGDVVDGVHAMGRSRSFFHATLISFLYFLLQVMPIYCLARAYGLDLSVWGSSLLLVVLRLGTVIPQAPGNVGTFQVMIVLGLRLLDVSRPDATAFATLLFVVTTGPLWLAGFVALLATRMRLGEIHTEAHLHMENRTGRPAPN